MADWVIGDLHGCLEEFEALVARIELNTRTDTLWLTGDLINRGPHCLDTLRRIHALSQSMGTRLRVVLGNHDLHLLACWAGLRQPSTSDTFDSILAAADADTLCNWLRQQPIMHIEGDHVLVHAGVYPGLSFDQNRTLADALHEGLRSDRFIDVLQSVYRRPTRKRPGASGYRGQLNFAAAALTRMRGVEPDMSLNTEEKGEPASLPSHITPWYVHAEAHFAALQIHTGHWAALGYGVFGPVVALDGGCVWGGELVAIERENPARPFTVQRRDRDQRIR